MKLHLLDRSTINSSSFSVKMHHEPHFIKTWHYHPELELIFVIKSLGTLFVGDGIEKFEDGDLVLIGENLPHMWLNDEIFFEKNTLLKTKAIAIHFKNDFLGVPFFETPEMFHLLKLFKKSCYGIKFKNVNTKLTKRIKKILLLEGFEKILALLKILHELAKHKDYKLLSSAGFLNTFQQTENKKLDKIYEYLFKNFAQPISLNAVADIANMNASAFSRFFKKMHNKTFSKYLNELRIGYACKLLITNKYNVSRVCYESGFNNISNFNRQFKSIMDLTPSQYLEKFKNF
ncbi:AraC family transcriptional regulator [Mariniflexile litorale]|uniref:AraC family transcriptional regulator n=1 Tax=Mariniflexile litorale TaxID=3045158 RepID=A0AAU7EIW3_9FLAO|nr:AraC family transcriptional regulator [Mariniflexile sp. KMM 9835]MDQ8210080.1 AraC family transcriptional regulator [Mariniflexile sp. KMM 9835]